MYFETLTVRFDGQSDLIDHYSDASEAISDALRHWGEDNNPWVVVNKIDGNGNRETVAVLERFLDDTTTGCILFMNQDPSYSFRSYYDRNEYGQLLARISYSTDGYETESVVPVVESAFMLV